METRFTLVGTDRYAESTDSCGQHTAAGGTEEEKRAREALLRLSSLGSKRRRRISARSTLLPERFAIIQLSRAESSLPRCTRCSLAIYTNAFYRSSTVSAARDAGHRQSGTRTHLQRGNRERGELGEMRGQPRFPRIMANRSNQCAQTGRFGTRNVHRTV